MRLLVEHFFALETGSPADKTSCQEGPSRASIQYGCRNGCHGHRVRTADAGFAKRLRFLRSEIAMGSPGETGSTEFPAHSEPGQRGSVSAFRHIRISTGSAFCNGETVRFSRGRCPQDRLPSRHCTTLVSKIEPSLSHDHPALPHQLCMCSVAGLCATRAQHVPNPFTRPDWREKLSKPHEVASPRKGRHADRSYRFSRRNQVPCKTNPTANPEPPPGAFQHRMIDCSNSFSATRSGRKTSCTCTSRSPSGIS